MKHHLGRSPVFYPVPTKFLHGHAEIVAASARNPIPDVICGVYFLVNDERIVYVGQSTNLLMRVCDHARQGRIKFQSFAYLVCDSKELDALESAYIFRFKPKENGFIGGGKRFATPLREDSPEVAALLLGRAA